MISIERGNFQLLTLELSDFIKKPYTQKERTPSSLSFDELEKLMLRRRSVRWFKNDLVKSTIFDKAVSIASQAPSACNRQPFRIINILHKKVIKDVTELAAGTSGFREQIPNLAVFIADYSNFPNERDRHVPYIDSSLFIMQLILLLETMGVGSCILNWAEDYRNNIEINKLLKLSNSERVIFLFAYGKPSDNCGIPYSEKKNPNQLVEHLG